MVVCNRLFRTIVGLQSKLYDLTQKRLVFGGQNGSKVSMENFVRIHMALSFFVKNVPLVNIIVEILQL